MSEDNYEKNLENLLNEAYRLLAELNRELLTTTDTLKRRELENQIEKKKDDIANIERELARRKNRQLSVYQGIVQTLYDAGQAVANSNNTLEETLEEICDQTLKILGVDHEQGFSHITLLQGTKLKWVAASLPEILDILNDKSGAEIDLNERLEKRKEKNKAKNSQESTQEENKAKNAQEFAPKEISMTGRVVLDQRPYIANSLEELKKYEYQEIKEGITSQLSVPIRLQKRIMGVLSVECFDRKFNEEDLNNVKRLAVQAAVAIRNNMRLRALREANDAIKRFNKNFSESKRIAEQVLDYATAKENLMTAICEQGLTIIGREHDQHKCLSYIILKKGNKIDLLGSSSKDPENSINKFINRIKILNKLPESIIKRVIDTLEPRYAPNVKLDMAYFDSEMKELDIKSQFSVPFKLANSVIGVYTVEIPELYAFSTIDLESLELIAILAAHALNYTLPYEEQQGRDWFEKVEKLIDSKEKIKETLRKIMQDVLQKELGIDNLTKKPDSKIFAHIAFVKDNTLGFVHTDDPEIENRLRVVSYAINLYSTKRRSISGRAAVTNEVQKISDVKHEKEDDYIAIDLGVTSQISIPVTYEITINGITDDKVVAVLGYEFTNQDDFKKAQEKLKTDEDIKARKRAVNQKFKDFVDKVRNKNNQELEGRFKEWLRAEKSGTSSDADKSN